MRSVVPLAKLLVLALLLPARLLAVEPERFPAPEPGWAQFEPYDPAAQITYPADEQQRELLLEQLLDLEGDRRNRQLIEQVRLVEEQQRGVDVTEQEWIELDDTKLRWGGRIQADWINWANDRQFGGQPNYFEFRRLRLFAAGEGYGVFNYMLEFEFANDFDSLDRVEEGGVSVKDAYLNADDVPLLGQVRIGHFLTPIGLERLTSSKNTTFLERGLTARFLPGRELGVAAFQNSADLNSTWAGGMFFDSLPESTYAIEGDNQGFRLLGRMTHTPIYDELADGRYLLHTGLGYSYTQPRRIDDPLQPGVPFYPVDFESRPEIHRGDDLVDTGNVNTQRYHVLNAELASVWGPFSMQAEATWTRVRDYDLGTTDLYGAYVFASYFLTGENRNYDRLEASFGRVTPLENFWIVDTSRGPQAGWGAWELAARWSYLDFSDRMGQQLNDLTVGCNWYWNPHTRMMFNWIHPFAHNSPEGIMPNSQGDILALRMEVSF